jgi:hypothetical protein
MGAHGQDDGGWGGVGGRRDEEKEESSFLKKRTKKLLFVWVWRLRPARSKGQKFFASFFQKRSAFFLPNHEAAPGFCARARSRAKSGSSACRRGTG